MASQNSQSLLALFSAAATAPPAGRQMMFRVVWRRDKIKRPLDVLCLCVDMICFVFLSATGCGRLCPSVCERHRESDRPTDAFSHLEYILSVFLPSLGKLLTKKLSVNSIELTALQENPQLHFCLLVSMMHYCRISLQLGPESNQTTGLVKSLTDKQMDRRRFDLKICF